MTPNINHKASFPSYDHDCHMSKGLSNVNEKIEFILRDSLVNLKNSKLLHSFTIRFSISNLQSAIIKN